MLAIASATSYWWTWFPGALAATLVVIGLGWRGIKWLVRGVDTMEKVQLALPRIEAEFSNNSGSTLRDAVDRVEAEQARVAQKLVAADSKIGRHIEADAVAFEGQARTNERTEATLGRIETLLRKDRP